MVRFPVATETLGAPEPEVSAPSAFARNASTAPPRFAAEDKRRAVGAFLAVAVILALTPATMIGAAMIGAAAGWTDWRSGFGYVALDWSTRTAFLSVATSTMAVVVAGMTGFAKNGGQALLALAITLATFSASALMHASGVTNPPL